MALGSEPRGPQTAIGAPAAKPTSPATNSPVRPGVVDFNLASIALDLNDLGSAERAYRSALAAFTKAGAGYAVYVLMAREGLANVAFERRELQTAASRYRELASAYQALQGADHLDVARVRFSIASTLLATARLGPAEREFRAVRSAYARIYGATSKEVASVDDGLARVAIERRAWAAAAALAEPLLARSDLHVKVRASIGFVMARVVLARDRDPARATTLAHAALVQLDATPGSKEASDIASWCRLHELDVPDRTTALRRSP